MKKLALLALTAATSAVVLAPGAHAAPVSNGLTPASGTVTLNMTMPKYAEIKNLTPAVAIGVTQAEYAADVTDPDSFSFDMRTNSSAGLTLGVSGSADAPGTSLLNEDLSLALNVSGTNSSPIAFGGLTATNQTIYTNAAPNNSANSYEEVVGSVAVNDIEDYTVTTAGLPATQVFSKTLTLTVLPN